MKRVSDRKLKSILNAEIKIGQCKICGRSGNIHILMPAFGKVGAYVECSGCGRKTQIYSIHTFLFSKRFLATPVTDDSLLQGIKEAINEWNGVK